MSDDFINLTELGKQYGVSSHKAGAWLVAVGLRTPDKKPSPRAFKEGYVEQRGSTQPGTYYWVWHRERTMKALDDGGIARAAGNEHQPGARTTGRRLVNTPRPHKKPPRTPPG